MSCTIRGAIRRGIGVLIERDVKNEGASGDLYENKRSGKVHSRRTGTVPWGSTPEACGVQGGVILTPDSWLLAPGSCLSKMKVHPEISMKTKSGRQIADPELSTFGRDVPNCSDNSCKPPRILQESGAFLSWIERGRDRSSFQNAASQALDFTRCRYGTNSCHQPPPALTRRPSLTKEGSVSLNQDGVT